MGTTSLQNTHRGIQFSIRSSLKTEGIGFSLVLFVLAGCGNVSLTSDLEKSREKAHSGRDLEQQNGLLSCAVDQSATQPMRRLSHRQYDQVVSDLLGVQLTPTIELGFPQDSKQYAFEHLAENLGMSPELLDLYDQAAQWVAERALNSPRVMTCSTNRQDMNACSDEIGLGFVRAAFRNQDVEVSWQRIRTQARGIIQNAPVAVANAHLEFVKTVVRITVLQPQFLFHDGLNDISARPLTDREMGNRLAFLFLGSIPDSFLQEAIDQKRVRSQLNQLIERYLADDVVLDRIVSELFGQWLGLNQSPDELQIPAEIADDLHTELVLVARDLVRSQRDLRDILRPGFTYVNARLARWYGMPVSVGANQWIKVQTPRRGGLLEMGAFLSNSDTKATHRGLLMLNQLLCTPIGSPSGVVLGALEDKGTYRKSLESLWTRPDCMGCHATMDPLGFALDQFDQFGRARVQNHVGESVNSKGWIGENFYDDSYGLAQILRQHPQFQSCMTEKVYAYLNARVPQGPDACHIRSMSESLAGESMTLQNMIRKIVLSENFLTVGKGDTQ